MRRPAVWALPLLLVTACKKQPTEAPEDERSSSSRSGYDDRAWNESPSVQPREVCEHLARMVAAEAGMSEVPVDPQMMAECESELGVEAGIRGTDNWNAIAGCVLQARTEADIDYCDRTYPMPSQGGPSQGGPSQGGSPGTSYDLSAVSDREFAVCEHMIEVLILESAAEMGAVPSLTPEERRSLVDECAGTLVFEQKPAQSPDAYEHMISCIEAAQTSDQMRACE